MAIRFIYEGQLKSIVFLYYHRRNFKLVFQKLLSKFTVIVRIWVSSKLTETKVTATKIGDWLLFKAFLPFITLNNFVSILRNI